MALKTARDRWGGLAIVGWLSFCIAGLAVQSVTLSWDSTSDPSAAGFYFYWGTSSGNYDNVVDVGTNTVFTATDLAEGQTYYFSVSTYDTNGIESGLAPEISYTAPGLTLVQSNAQPSMAALAGFAGLPEMRVQFPVNSGHQYVVQTSTNLLNWTNEWTSAIESTDGWDGYVDVSTNPPCKFYRLLTY